MMSVDASPLNGVGPYQLPLPSLPSAQQPFQQQQQHRGSLDDLAYAFSQVQTFHHHPQHMAMSTSPPPMSSSASPTLLPAMLAAAAPLDGSSATTTASASAAASTLVFDQIAQVAQTLTTSGSPTPSLLGTSPADVVHQQQQPRARAAAAAQGLSLSTANLPQPPLAHTPPSAIMSAASPMSAHAMLSASVMSTTSSHVPPLVSTASANAASTPMQSQDSCGSGSDSDGSSSSGTKRSSSSKKLSNASSTGSAAAAATEAAASSASGDGEKQRSRLTREQMSALKRVYAVTYFPDKQTKEQLSRELNIPVRTIQIWFQNQRQYHRIKMKKKATQQAQQQHQTPQVQQPNFQAQAAAVAQQQAMIAAMSGAVPAPSANPGLVVNTNASITTVAPAGSAASVPSPFSPSPFMAAPAASPGADSGIGSATPTTPFGSAASPFPGQPGPQTTRRNSAPPHFFGQVPTSLPPMPLDQQQQQHMAYQPPQVQTQQMQQQQPQRRGSVMMMPTAMPTLHEHQPMYQATPTDQQLLPPAPQYGDYQQQQPQQAFPSSQQFDLLFNQSMVAPAAEPMAGLGGGCNVPSPVPVQQYNPQQQQVFSPAEHTWQQQQFQQQQQPMVQRGRSYSNTFF